MYKKVFGDVHVKRINSSSSSYLALVFRVLKGKSISGEHNFSIKSQAVQIDISIFFGKLTFYFYSFHEIIFFRGLNKTKISEVPSIGLSNLAQLHLNGVTSINSVSDEVINLPKLTKVYVDEQRRFLCCAFLHKRGDTLRSTKKRTNRTRNCVTKAPITAAATSTKGTDGGRSTTSRPTGSTTTDHFGGGFGRRKRALLWFGDWVPSNKTGTDPVKTRLPLQLFTC